jgi:hypothetical protein
LKYLLLFIEQT